MGFVRPLFMLYGPLNSGKRHVTVSLLFQGTPKTSRPSQEETSGQQAQLQLLPQQVQEAQRALQTHQRLAQGASSGRLVGVRRLQVKFIFLRRDSLILGNGIVFFVQRGYSVKVVHKAFTDTLTPCTRS
jgi:hypothetical protein